MKDLSSNPIRSPIPKMLSVVGGMFSYLQGKPVFTKLNLDLFAGEMLVITGRSGCGKSTLLRCMMGLYELDEGQIFVHQKRIEDMKNMIHHIGFVSQKPQEQVLCERIDDEIAFAMESISMPVEEMSPQITKLLQESGLSIFSLDHPTKSLSGGQTQRLMTAAARAARAKILVLDEPFAHLDQKGIRELMDILQQFTKQGGSVLIVEHRLHELLDVAHRLIIMDKEQQHHKTYVLPPSEEIWTQIQKCGLRIPLQQIQFKSPAQRNDDEKQKIVFPPLRYQYSNRNASEHFLIDMECIECTQGQRIFIVGENGAGKSTLLRLLAGDIQTSVSIAPDLSKMYVPQDADLMLFCDTVEDELLYGAREKGYFVDGEAIANSLGFLEELKEGMAPYELSRGQRLRLAIGAALSTFPDLLFLDEPTSGQDFCHIESIMDVLCLDTTYQNITIFVVTHDIEFAIQYADEIWVLEKGRRIFCGSPRDVKTISFLKEYKDLKWLPENFCVLEELL